MEYPLSKKIGIVSGGQLCKMMILEAKKMGFYVAVLDPDPHCPASSICDKHILGNFPEKPFFGDTAAYLELAEQVDVVTFDFEHIDVAALREVAKIRPVYPSPESLAIIQNKLTQKQTLQKNGAAVPEFMEVCGIEEIRAAGEKFGYPLMLKATTGGYDGKGNYTVKSAADVEGGFAALGGGKIQLMAERYVDFDREISVLACRSIAGEIAIYPIGQNRHHEEILRETAVPADISESAKNAAITLAHQVMEIFQGVGIFCVEMFLHRDNTVSVNEIAPRPHNSGHYTIEGCFTSQFEQHIRAIAGLPLGDCGLIMPAVMQNVLGEDGHAGPTLVAGASDVLEIPGAYLHMYGKIETRPKRKMGHITALGATIEEATERAAKAKAALKVISK